MNVETMGWELTDVAPAGHMNAGLSVQQRMEKYGISVTDPQAFYKLMRREQDEARASGLAPDVPITPGAAAVVAQWAPEEWRADLERIARQRWTPWLVGGGVVVVLVFLSRRRR